MAPGWAVFRNEQGKILKEENPDMAAADRLKELHAQWDALTDEQRAEYRETAVHNVERLRLLNARSLSLSLTHTHTHTYTMGTGISYGRGKRHKEVQKYHCRSPEFHPHLEWGYR
jgi:hypothetical protein